MSRELASLPIEIDDTPALTLSAMRTRCRRLKRTKGLALIVVEIRLPSIQDWARSTADSLQGLLAHEMAHTWPAMQGEHGDTAWYSEGAAEYYSTVLSFRAGAISVDRLLKTFNERADAYYSNPYVAASNPEAAKKFWTDPVAQTVPYGRGWLYLQKTDASVRTASQGRRSLDDVVKAMRQRQVADKPYGIY